MFFFKPFHTCHNASFLLSRRVFPVSKSSLAWNYQRSIIKNFTLKCAIILLLFGRETPQESQISSFLLWRFFIWLFRLVLHTSIPQCGQLTLEWKKRYLIKKFVPWSSQFGLYVTQEGCVLDLLRMHGKTIQIPIGRWSKNQI